MSEAAIRDVSEAYRTIPLRPDQWPGMVVRLADADSFAVDPCCCFGLASSAGVHGIIGDASADLIRAQGIGPIAKWVDDNFLVRIKRQFVEEYNCQRARWRSTIIDNGGQLHDGGRLWFRGKELPNGKLEEFQEDFAYPIINLPIIPSDNPHTQSFSYSPHQLDDLSRTLGIPWEESKEILFATSTIFTGLLWDLENRTVTLPENKKAKYSSAITVWQSSRTHTLQEVAKLHGKLLHASLVVPAGRAYLTGLETMVGIFGDRPFMPRTPPRQTVEELIWWQNILNNPIPPRPIPGPVEVHDPNAYSDASSTIGIAVVINQRWRAWRLAPNWKAEGRDITWAEAIGLELLVAYLPQLLPHHRHFKVFGDNRGVVEGWWKGRSRNQPTNQAFRRIHTTCETSNIVIHTRYVESASNPADGPSRGIYPNRNLLLPPLPIPPQIRHLILDFDAPRSPLEERLSREDALPAPASKLIPQEARAEYALTNRTMELRATARFSHPDHYL